MCPFNEEEIGAVDVQTELHHIGEALPHGVGVRTRIARKVFLLQLRSCAAASLTSSAPIRLWGRLGLAVRSFALRDVRCVITLLALGVELFDGGLFDFPAEPVVALGRAV